MKSVVFKVRGEYARFRKSYTTTSALTYLVMHPISIRGMIGAILGIDKNDLYEETKHMEIGIQVLKEVKKDMQSFNLLNMKSSDKFFIFPSNVEFVRNVEYIIFLKFEETKLQQIKDVLASGEFVFTPYLGASEHVAKIEYEAELDLIPMEKGTYQVDTIVDKNRCIVNIDDEEIILYTDNIPVKNNENREYIEYKKIVFSTNKKLKVETDVCYKVGDYNVVFL